MANITKQDLVHEIAKSTGFIQSDIKLVVEEMLDSLTNFLAEDKKIEIRGFGTFSTKLRKSRPARNPRTGEIVQLDKRIAPLFKYSTDLKESINQSWLNSLPEIMVNNDKIESSEK